MSRRATSLLLSILLAAVAMPSRAQVASSGEAPLPPVVEITATDYAFRAPDAIPSGWTTFRFRNDGQEPHFVLLSRLPEGTTVEDYETELSVPFNDIWYALREGDVDADGAAAMMGEMLPAWLSDLAFMGGPGLLEAGATSETTLELPPGDYVLECYMRTADGEVHYMEGMMRPLVVTHESTAARPPDADARITLSNFRMDIDGELGPGRRTVAVHLTENPEVGFGHNVHVARLNPDTPSDAVVGWMNWFNVDALRPPAPVTFIGGNQLMPPGTTAYITLDLEPGRYLFVSEYTGHQGVLQEVTIGPEAEGE